MRSQILMFTAAIAAGFALMGPTRASDVLPSLTLEDEPEQPSDAPIVVAPAKTQAVAVEGPAKVAAEASTGIDAAKEKGIAFLKDVASKDVVGFFAPPVRNRIAVGWEEKPLRYSLKLVDVPVYETVEVFRDVKVGESVDSAKVRQKVKIQKKVGTKKEQREVLDRNGDIEKMTKMPKFGEGGPDEWRSFLFGQNAMAIYALIEAGVDPTDAVVLNPAEELLKLYEQYGMPDLTWDLAWSIAAFSKIDQPAFQDMARNMSGKLLDGQIADGEATGLWGPVCINTSLLAAMLKKQNEYSQFYLAAKAKFDEKKTPNYESKMQAALDALRLFAKLIKRASMLGSSAFDDRIMIALRDESGIANPINVPGYPSYLVNQTAADMESTAIALFGIRVAIDKKLLPTETWRPTNDKGLPLVPPKTTATVLRAALSAIVKAQKREGWSELNIHQPVKDFDNMKGLAGVPADPTSFKPLASPVTETSIAQGYSAFTCYERAYGMRGLTPLARNIVAGNAIVKSVLDAGVNAVKGGQVAPYDFCFFLSAVPDLGKPEYDLHTAQRLSEFLVAKQNRDGSWGSNPLKRNLLPSSLRERIASLPARYGIPAGVTPCELSVAHVPFGNDAEKKHMTMSRVTSFYTKNIATSYALLTLAALPAIAGE